MTSRTAYGPLQPWVDDDRVTDVLVNADGSVWADRGWRCERVGETVSAETLRLLATRLAGLAGRRLDDSQPWVDAQLPDGVRLHAVLPPLAEAGACLSLRLPRAQPRGVEGLLALGAVGPELARVLVRLVAARVSFVVSGGTGSGKTTVLGALLAECDARDRLVVVEDVRELRPEHPHVVRLQGRSANVEGAGAVSLVDLVRQALRMRPDRLVVGEVRGPEVRELLQALNTGHEGGASTLHANRPEDVPARFEALGALAGFGREAVHAQLRGAVGCVVHCVRAESGRRVASVSVLEAGQDGLVRAIRALETTSRSDAPPTGERRPGAPGAGQKLVRLAGWAALEELLGPRPSSGAGEWPAVAS